MLYLKKSKGQTGNNILQLLGMLYISNKNEDAFIISNEFKEGMSDIFDFNKIDKLFNVFGAKKEVLRHEFHKPYQLGFYDNPKREYFEIGKKLRECLKIGEGNVRKNTLYIHIRSGEVFLNKDENYTQPPLNFYVKIIEDTAYDNYVIITQKIQKNPVIAKLKQKYPEIKVRNSSLLDDVKLLLSVENLVIGRSTFPVSLLYLNPNLENLYTLDNLINRDNHYDIISLEMEDVPSSVKYYSYYAKDYIKLGEFDGRKKETKKEMINFPYENVNKVLNIVE